MSDKLNSLLKDEKRLKEFSNNAQINIEKFKLKPIIEKWENILINL